MKLLNICLQYDTRVYITIPKMHDMIPSKRQKVQLVIVAGRLCCNNMGGNSMGRLGDY